MNQFFFVKNSPDFADIKLIIKEQSKKCCRGEFDKKYVTDALDECTHGFIMLGAKLVERNKSHRSHYYLKGFILFRYKDRDRTIDGYLICADKGSPGTASILLHDARQFAIDHNVTYITLSARPHIRLISYYEKYGFIIKDVERNNRTGETELVHMYYPFNNEIINQDNNKEITNEDAGAILYDEPINIDYMDNSELKIEE